VKTQPLKTDIFVNECSLQAQFQSISEFETAIINFIALIEEIKAKNNFNADFYRGNIFINVQAIKNQVFQKNFNELKQASQTKFKRLLTTGLKDWQKQSLHQSTDNYTLVETKEDITNTSIAEVSERKLQRNEIVFLLVNFTNSNFKKSHPKYQLCQIIPVSKNQKHNIELDCLDNKDAFEQWVQDKLDFRSLLERENQRYTKTTHEFQGKIVYKEIKTGYFWYLDNLHKNHFEVFDNQGRHLGEADLQGSIDTNKADKSKKYKP